MGIISVRVRAEMQAEGTVWLRAGLISSALWLSYGCSVAHAQQTAPSGASAASQVSGSSDTNQLEEVIVKASKLAQPIDRSPISATELDATAIEQARIENIEDVQVRVPSLVYQSPSNFGEAYIRGIGTHFTLAGLESTVGTYVDGVYLQRQGGSALDILDVSSVTVLKGPQGTLYGRNATGGAIVVQTADPTQEFGGYGALEYGRFNRTKADGVLNLPITSTLAFRFAIEELTDSGFIKDTVDGGKYGLADNQVFRGKVRWTPTAQFEAVYSLEYDNMSNNAFAQHQRLTAPLCLACAIYDIVPASGFYDSTQEPATRNTIQIVAHTFRLSYTTEQFTANSISGYRITREQLANPNDDTSADFFNSAVTESGPTFTNDTFVRTTFRDPINFLAGISYVHDKDEEGTRVFGSLFGPLQDIEGFNYYTLNSLSGYLDLYYDITPQLKLTAGARYNVDHKELAGFNNAEAAPVLAGGVVSWRTGQSFHETTPRVVLSYDSDVGYYYASYGKGAKSGGFSTPSFTAPIPVKPETLDSFEIGAKNQFLNQSIKTSAAIFYGTYKDVQVSFINAQAGGEEVNNAASARVYGAEADVHWLASEQLNLVVGGDYLHNKFTSYPSASVYAPNPAGPGLELTSENLAGTDLPRSPRYSFYIGWDYHTTIAGGWHMDFSGTDRYTASYLFLAGGGGPLNLDRQGGFQKLSASLTFAIPSERTQFGIFGDNLTGKKYYEFSESSAYGDAYAPAPPLTYGIRIKQKF